MGRMDIRVVGYHAAWFFVEDQKLLVLRWPWLLLEGAAPAQPGLCGLEKDLFPKAPHVQCCKDRLADAALHDMVLASHLIQVLCPKQNSW